ncbi:hypothetical protein KIF59_08520 [Enterobacter cloacae subsp. cloacae]|nr:hypothetical protein [Enterobacter cloacae subsp. cloacae]
MPASQEGSTSVWWSSRTGSAFCRGWYRAPTKSAGDRQSMQKHSLVL